jgi:hypothetical protein
VVATGAVTAGAAGVVRGGAVGAGVGTGGVDVPGDGAGVWMATVVDGARGATTTPVVSDGLWAAAAAPEGDGASVVPVGVSFTSTPDDAGTGTGIALAFAGGVGTSGLLSTEPRTGRLTVGTHGTPSTANARRPTYPTAATATSRPATRASRARFPLRSRNTGDAKRSRSGPTASRRTPETLVQRPYAVLASSLSVATTRHSS